MNKILRVFLDTNMSLQHHGLREVCRKAKVNLDTLIPGEHVMFVNTKLNKAKLYGASGVVSYIRKDSGKLDLNMIEMIPQSFLASGGVDWVKAQRLSLEKKLGYDGDTRSSNRSTEQTWNTHT